MAKVKIICGTYGFRTESGVVEPKNVDSLPFEVSDKEASRLVSLKVAEIVSEKTEEKPAEAPKKGKKAEKTEEKPAEDESAEGTEALEGELNIKPQDVQ